MKLKRMCAICARKMSNYVAYDDTIFCYACANTAHYRCWSAHDRNKHPEYCVDCFGCCVRDKDGDLWWQLPNKSWVVDNPLGYWTAGRSEWATNRSLEDINRSYGPIEFLTYLIKEEEELMFA